MSGTLYVVATPIGNLEDLTFRALRILRETDLIAAEDTRRTAKLLAHYDIRKPVISLREHNEVRETPRLVERLRRGERIALVSDAGTPAIADPGARLVQAARNAQITVVPIPGPSAITAALSVAGLPDTEFVFMGFPPPAGTPRRQWFEGLERESRAVVFFEAPHRLRRTLDDLGEYVKRPIQIHRELTKFHEKSIIEPRNVNSRIAGEFVLIVGPAGPRVSSEESKQYAADLIGRLTNNRPIEAEEAIALAAAASGLLPREVRKILKKRRFSGKQHKGAGG